MKKRNNKEKCDNGIGPTCQNVTRMFGNRASHTNQYGSPALFYITISGNQSIGFFDSFCSRQSTSLFATVRQIRPHIHYHKGLSAFRMKSYPKLTTIVQFLFFILLPETKHLKHHSMFRSINSIPILLTWWFTFFLFQLSSSNETWNCFSKPIFFHIKI